MTRCDVAHITKFGMCFSVETDEYDTVEYVYVRIFASPM